MLCVVKLLTLVAVIVGCVLFAVVDSRNGD